VNLLCNIFINVTMFKMLVALGALISIIVYFRGPTSFWCSCKNLVHFFNQNPFANTYVCFILYLSILVICLSHFVNFVPIMFGCMFRSHGPSFIKLINILHPITFLKNLFSHRQPFLSYINQGIEWEKHLFTSLLDGFVLSKVWDWMLLEGMTFVVEAFGPQIWSFHSLEWNLK
jgi:uncharacterized Tic20 family protein